ncbi:cytochrome C [Bacillus coahuilensis m2-6]|uniref:cytochrome c550 n=1 Tax=Bacillus coahuilensis TaxID=408580 RepID=UPI000185114B|nr:cytochrome c [Bacillus coahuilensis]KUP07222.1 cytochrome C [Bacillus coahuilensis m2-6]
MNRNPIIPFLLIMVMGIGLVFFLSLEGLGNQGELAHEGEETTEGGETAAGFDPEAHYQSACIGCHGGNYEGGVGPTLIGVGDKYSAEELSDILINGKGAMPGNLVPADNVEAMVEWLTTLE